MSSSSTSSPSNGSAAAPPCPFSADSLNRDQSCFAQAVQRVENCLTSMQRINDQISSLAQQRRKLQDELRGIQCQINEEFERILKPTRSAPAPAKVVSRTVTPEPVTALRMESRMAEIDPVAMALVAG